jgi:hypothetical protein
MRHLIGIVAVCFGLQVIVSAQAPGTAFELADDQLGGALWRIAVATHTRIGFESVEFVRLSRLRNVPAFPISSRDEALKAAVDADPRYEWRNIGDFVVVRPKSAWSDSADPFNRPVRNLRIENAMSNAVLLGLRDFIYTNRFAVPPGPRGIPVSFDVQSGTVVDALNRLMESADNVLWIASYRPNAQLGQRLPSWDLQMRLMNATSLHGLTESHPPRGLR